MTAGLLVDEVAPALAAGHGARLGDAAPEDMEDRARFLAAGIIDAVAQQVLRPAGPGDAARVATRAASRRPSSTAESGQEPADDGGAATAQRVLRVTAPPSWADRSDQMRVSA